MFASRPYRLALTVTCRQILGRPDNAGALEQAENGQQRSYRGYESEDTSLRCLIG